MIISRNLPPLTGGMERLNEHVCRAVASRFRTVVCGPTGCESRLDKLTDCAQVEPLPLSRFLAGSLWHAMRLARKHRPDVVYSGSGLTAPAAIISARLTGAPVVCFLHGLDLVARSRPYRALWLPAIRQCALLLVNSRHTASLAESTGVSSDRIRIEHPGVRLPDQARREEGRTSFRNHLGIGDVPVLLSVGRLTERKGMVPFVKHVMPGLVEKIPALKLVIAGGDPGHALRAGSGDTSEIVSAARQVSLEDHLVFTGALSEDDLGRAYFAADVLVFPVQEIPGDVEGFGMVAIEAAAHGLPTVAFAAGGVPDAVAHNESGWLVRSGDYGKLRDVIVAALADPDKLVAMRESCIAHAGKFEWSGFELRVAAALEAVASIR